MGSGNIILFKTINVKLFLSLTCVICLDPEMEPNVNSILSAAQQAIIGLQEATAATNNWQNCVDNQARCK